MNDKYFHVYHHLLQSPDGLRAVLPTSQAALDSARSGKDSERTGVAVAVSKTMTVVDGPF
jgi:hypothetical protein